MTRDEYISYLTQDDTYSLDEAKKLADQQFGGKPTTPTASSPFSEEAGPQATQATQREMKTERAKQEGGLSGFWHGLSGPEQMGLATGGLLGTGLALYGAHSALKNTGTYGAIGSAGKSIKDRLFIQKQASVDPLSRVDPLMDINQTETIKAVAEQPKTEAHPKSPYSPAEQEMLAQSEKNRIDKQIEAATKAEQGKVPGSTKPTTAPQAVAPIFEDKGRISSIMASQEMVNPLGGQASAYIEPLKPSEPPSSKIKEAGGEKKQITTKVEKETAVVPLTRDAKGNIVYPDTMSPAARAGAEEFKKKYPNHAADLAKKELIGVMGFGAADNSLYNTYGAEGRKAVLDYFRQGQPLGKYENYLPFAQKIGENVPAVPPRDVPELMSRVPSDVEAGNYGKLGIPASIGGEKGGVVKGQKQVAAALKAGGPALLLLGAAGAANAREAARAIGEGLLPIGMTPSEAGAPVLPPSVLAAQKRQLEEMQKLGSPYRTR